MLNLHITSKFKRQLKNYQYNEKVMQRLEQCGEEILSGTIDEKRRRDCFLVAIGSHADLFG